MFCMASWIYFYDYAIIWKAISILILIIILSTACHNILVHVDDQNNL